MEETEYKAVRFAQDFYNDITADEINDIYAFQKKVKKVALLDMMFDVIQFIVIAVIALPIVIISVKQNIASILSDSVSELLCYIILYLACAIASITAAVKTIRKWKHFYFAKGTIIDLENEFYEADKAHPDGYWRHTITLAVSETECLKNIFYFDNKKWRKENYIGESAVAVYFPDVHLMYAMINGEDAENFDKFSNEMFKKKNKAVKN